MKVIKKYSEFIFEVLIVFLFLFILNNFTKKTDEIIVSDGVGYYEYLPSTFISKDIYRYNQSIDLSRVNSNDIYIDYKDGKINKYPCGTALLQAPFFVYTLLFSDSALITGYEKRFHKSVFVSAVFYLLLALVFIRKLFNLFLIKKYITVLIQLLLVLGTNVYFYSHYNSSFSHIYSFFLITTFLYFVKKYLQSYSLKYFYLMIVFLGLIVLVRQINIIVILAIPFISGSWLNFKEGFNRILNLKLQLFLGMFLFLAILALQSVFWFLQVGEFVVYSYQGETFDFLNPQILNILFSYQKGLFLYTPILGLVFISSFYFLFNARYFIWISFSLFFLSLTYVLSSWWAWSYGCSFGLRAYLDFYTIFFLMFALVLNELKFIYSIGLLCFQSVFIPINLIQSYQYKEFILHWDQMNKEKYWKVFLKTKDQFKGVIWDEGINEWEFETIESSTDTLNNSESLLIPLNSVLLNSKRPLLRLNIENMFSEENTSRISVSIDSKESVNYFTDERYLLEFCKGKFNEYQQGYFLYSLPEFDFDTSFFRNADITIKIKSNKLEVYPIDVLQKVPL